MVFINPKETSARVGSHERSGASLTLGYFLLSGSLCKSFKEISPPFSLPVSPHCRPSSLHQLSMHMHQETILPSKTGRREAVLVGYL